MPSPRSHVWSHCLALVAAAVGFVLVLAGGATTSMAAGDSIPHWTWRFWTWFRDWREVESVAAGGFYELSHRQVGTVLGFVLLAFCILVQWTDERRWMRRLAWITLAAVCLQGLLGALRVLVMIAGSPSQAWAQRVTGLRDADDLRILTAVLHAPFAYALFGALSALVVFTAPRWRREGAGAPPAGAEALRGVSLAAALVIFVQLIFGAYVRHAGLARWALLTHVAGALAVGLTTGWAAVRAFPWSAQARRLRATALTLGLLAQLQIALGVCASLFCLTATLSPWTPLVRTAHQLVGPLLLAWAVSLNLYVRAWGGGIERLSD